MKLKYYLRGFGIGMIVATVILTVSYNIRSSEAGFEGNSQMQSQESTGSIIAYTTAADKTASSAPAKQEESDTVRQDGEKITVEITGAYYATTAAEILYEAGVIDDSGAFAQYMHDNGYSTLVNDGVYEFVKGDSYENIAKIITRMQ